jgi:hypothetical protein
MTMFERRTHRAIALLLLCLTFGCRFPQPNVTLELFLVSPGDGDAVAYGRRQVEMFGDSADPDQVARGLIAPTCRVALLHSTSWRWERNGTLVLTYLAFSEDPTCRSGQPSRLAWSEILPPQSTDPQKPRPAEIREQDVLAHAVRHITFLVRYSADRRVAEALSPRSLTFFRSMCGQLAGRYETAREFADCAGLDPPK